jgi:hypothetical protein
MPVMVLQTQHSHFLDILMKCFTINGKIIGNCLPCGSKPSNKLFVNAYNRRKLRRVLEKVTGSVAVVSLSMGSHWALPVVVPINFSLTPVTAGNGDGFLEKRQAE